MANRVDAGEEEICNFEEIQGHRWSSCPERKKICIHLLSGKVTKR